MACNAGFSCQFCPKSYVDNTRLRRHVKASHPGEDLPPCLPRGQPAAMSAVIVRCVEKVEVARAVPARKIAARRMEVQNIQFPDLVGKN